MAKYKTKYFGTGKVPLAYPLSARTLSFKYHWDEEQLKEGLHLADSLAYIFKQRLRQLRAAQRNSQRPRTNQAVVLCVHNNGNRKWHWSLLGGELNHAQQADVTERRRRRVHE